MVKLLENVVLTDGLPLNISGNNFNGVVFNAQNSNGTINIGITSGMHKFKLNSHFKKINEFFLQNQADWMDQLI